MREIKFRFWNTKKETMHYVFKGGDTMSALLALENQPETATLMQYTSLKDKNGKEIYEGDIVQITEDYEFLYDEDEDITEKTQTTGVVDFWCAEGGFVVKSTNNEDDCMIKWVRLNSCQRDTEEIDSEALIVIGNIYENPSLL